MTIRAQAEVGYWNSQAGNNQGDFASFGRVAPLSAVVRGMPIRLFPAYGKAFPDRPKSVECRKRLATWNRVHDHGMLNGWGGARMEGRRTQVSTITIGAPQSGQTKVDRLDPKEASADSGSGGAVEAGSAKSSRTHARWVLRPPLASRP